MVTSIPWPVNYISRDPHNLGWYATPLALSTAHPVASSGDFAVVGTTDTVWVWDADTSAWVDSGAMYPVDSVFGRTGAVIAEPGDYNAAKITNDSVLPGSYVKDSLNVLAKYNIVRGYNAGASSITKGTVVKVSGTSVAAAPEDGIPTIEAVSSISDVVYGVVYSDIAAGSGGHIINKGLLSGVLDTSGSAINAPIYFDAAGALTLTDTGSQIVAYVASINVAGDIYAIIGTKERDKIYDVTISTEAELKSALDTLQASNYYTSGIIRIAANINTDGVFNPTNPIDKDVCLVGIGRPTWTIGNGFLVEFYRTCCTVKVAALDIVMASSAVCGFHPNGDPTAGRSVDFRMEIMDCHFTNTPGVGGYFVSPVYDGVTEIYLRHCTTAFDNEGTGIVYHSGNAAHTNLYGTRLFITACQTDGPLARRADPAFINVQVEDSVIADTGGIGVWRDETTVKTSPFGQFTVEFDTVSTIVRQVTASSTRSPSFVQKMPYRIITATTTFYIDPDAGDDANDGLTVGTAWKTWDHMYHELSGVTIDDCAVVVNILGSLYEASSVSGMTTRGFITPNVQYLGQGSFAINGDTRELAGLTFVHEGVVSTGAAVATTMRGTETALSRPAANQIQITKARGTACTFNAGTDKVTLTSHGFLDGEAIVFSTTDTLPSYSGGNITEGVIYYVRDKTANDFKLALTSGGAALDITSTGVGTQYLARNPKFTTAGWVAGDNVIVTIGTDVYIGTLASVNDEGLLTFETGKWKSYLTILDKGFWDASGGGTPALAVSGNFYTVSVAGTIDIAGVPTAVVAGQRVLYSTDWNIYSRNEVLGIPIADPDISTIGTEGYKVTMCPNKTLKGLTTVTNTVYHGGVSVSALTGFVLETRGTTSTTYAVIFYGTENTGLISSTASVGIVFSGLLALLRNNANGGLMSSTTATNFHGSYTFNIFSCYYGSSTFASAYLSGMKYILFNDVSTFLGGGTTTRGAMNLLNFQGYISAINVYQNGNTGISIGSIYYITGIHIVGAKVGLYAVLASSLKRLSVSNVRLSNCETGVSFKEISTENAIIADLSSYAPSRIRGCTIAIDTDKGNIVDLSKWTTAAIEVPDNGVAIRADNMSRVLLPSGMQITSENTPGVLNTGIQAYNGSQVQAIGVVFDADLTVDVDPLVKDVYGNSNAIVLTAATDTLKVKAPVAPTDAVNKAYIDKRAVNGITTADTPYAVTLDDYSIVVDASGGVVNVDLPDASTCEGQIFNIIAADVTNAVTVTPNGAQTISGVAGAHTIVVQWVSLTLQAFNGNWIII